MNTHNLSSLQARRAARGFTLVELIVVLAIASVLASAAVPSFVNLMRSMRMSSGTTDLFSSMLVARSEAAKRHSRVSLCKSEDGASCAATGGWEQGWIVFHDANNNGRRDPGEQLIERVAGMNGSLRIIGNLNIARYISYASTGETKMASGAFQAGTITVCNVSARAGDARQIVISAVGRPRIQRARVAQCA